MTGFVFAPPAPASIAVHGDAVGRAKDTYRRVRIDSTFGKIAVLVTDGQLPYEIGARLALTRRALGLTRFQMARLLGTDCHCEARSRTRN